MPRLYRQSWVLGARADSTSAGEIVPDGNITVTEIYNYLLHRVRQATRGQQTPMLKAPELAGEMLLTEGTPVRERRITVWQ
jgi:hypothetical protein